MTTFDPLATPDALALLAAIDDRFRPTDALKDGTVGVLADLLEEVGDARAAGLRRYDPDRHFICDFGRIPGGMVDVTLASIGDAEVFARIRPTPSEARPYYPGEWRFYRRSSALLAIAEALADG